MMELPAELEAAIRATPDDRDGYLVAADWLTSQDDPQGELIALSLSPPTDAVRSRIDALHRRLSPVRADDPFGPLRLEWRWGFVIGIAMAGASPADVRALLRSPVARFVRTLVLEIASASSIRAIAAERRTLASLHTLIARTDDVGGDVERLLEATPALEQLRLAGADWRGVLGLPRLRELSIHRDALDLESTLPQLERLQLQLPEPGRAWLEQADLRSRWSGLRRLTLVGVQGDPAIWRSPGLANLELFDLMWQAEPWRTHRAFVVDQIGERAGQRAGLVAMTGSDALAPGTVVEITAHQQFVAGRLPTADLVIDALSLSRRHTSFLRRAGWVVSDLGTRSGTMVNGCRVNTCPLRSGDEVAIGGAVFRFLGGNDLDAQAAELRARFALSST